MSSPLHSTIRLKFVLLVIAVLLFGVAGCSSIHTTAMATIPAGTVASAVAGEALPAVVLQSGLGDGKDSWKTVFTMIAESNRVFAYDRPGYGDSPAVKSPRDPCTIAAELKSALVASGLAPPYVLVGHSLGGLYQFVFAKLYPEDVAGLVLLDPTHPDHWKRLQQDAPATATFIKGLRHTVFDATSRNEFDDQATCLERIDMKTPMTIPVRLLTRTKFEVIESGSFETMVHSLENDWRRLLGVQNIHRVAGAGHYIHKDQPEVVVQELRSLIGELSANNK
jgi:pimeloyl-ACP methyl ester carboxylesterase